MRAFGFFFNGCCVREVRVRSLCRDEFSVVCGRDGLVISKECYVVRGESLPIDIAVVFILLLSPRGSFVIVIF